MKDQLSDIIQRREALKAENLRLKLANSIAIIGGGIVGVELAGEILSKYPNKSLTFFHSHKTLLNNTSSPDGAHKVALAFLNEHQVTIHFEERVTSAIFDNNLWTIHSTMSSGTKRKTTFDKVYFCAGFICNTEFMRKNFTDSMNEKGELLIDNEFRVKNTKNIYAVGDVVGGVADLKTAYVAGEQAKFLGSNLKRMKEGKTFGGSYKPAGLAPPIMAISLGPFRGIFIFAGKIISTKRMACDMKNNFEKQVLLTLGQAPEAFNVDLNKTLRDEIRTKNTNEQEEDGNPDDIKATYDTLAKFAVTGTEDIFH